MPLDSDAEAASQPASEPPPFTPREREVVALALSGLTTAAIASGCKITASTVRVLLARAAAKLGAKSRAELVSKAAALPWPGTTDECDAVPFLGGASIGCALADGATPSALADREAAAL